ncbi:hypothetical protein FOCC_FOCC016294 [Frankliniella occidentalis]|nr:hypothetical protein FOCC_FOCC016294 [Frankliniella occidentalis]
MWLAPLTSPAAWTAQAQTNCSAASVFAALLTAIVTKGIATAQQKAKQTKDIVQGPYDFIVIGGGSSGSVVASRLSEVSSWKVLLLESGAEEPDLGMVPALYNRYLTGPFYDWQYTSQKSAWDAGRSIYRDVNSHGDKVLVPKKSIIESVQIQDVMLDSYLAPNTQLLMQAYEEAGIPSVQDVNGAKQIGVSRVLMLSGIGPKQHLSDVGIKPIVDLPGVGQRLHDHMYAKANVFFRSKYQKAGDPRPDIQIPIGGSQYLTSKGKNCATPETAGTYFNQLGFNAINLHPKSRGQILLNKTDPYGMPLIYYNIFGDESDLKPIYEAFRLAVKLNSTKVFRDNGITMSHNVPSQCAKLTFNTDEFWKCTFNGVGSANGHPTSTCSMGPDSDKLAVVTPRLEVRGVYGLRVIDASVMPGTPSGNTNAVCVMIGEVGSDFIKQDYKTSESVA